MPCETRSRARDRGPLRKKGETKGWPSRLRSAQELWGLAALENEWDLAQLHLGNKLTKFCISLWTVCVHMQIPFTIENPASSRLWFVEFLQAALQRPGFDYSVTD